MQTPLFRMIACLTLTVSFGMAHIAFGDDAVSTPSDDDWRQITQLAKAFVDRESPPDVMPFAPDAAKRPSDRPRQVFIHYFPFFQNSFDNLPPAKDLWTGEFLARDGEGGKWHDAGGMVRERPLPAGPWTGPYWRELNVAVDILRARRMGADGFGLDLGSVASGPSASLPAWKQAIMICHAASVVAPDFRILIEPDALILAKASAREVADAVHELANCTAAARAPDGRLLLVPFLPENEPDGFWQEVMGYLAQERTPIAFIPDFVTGGDRAKRLMPISYGLTDWGLRDPAQIAQRSQLPPSHEKTRVWMHPIAPQDMRPKSSMFWEADNTEMFRASWADAMREDADYVHILTWNDYGEGTEISPSSGTQFLFYDLGAYFIEWYKTGMMPRINRDAIYYDHRTQIFDPKKPPRVSDHPFRQMGPTPARNRVEMVAMLTKPANLEIQIGEVKKRISSQAGLAVLQLDALPGRPIFRIIRGDKTVLEKISDWTIDPAPDIENPAYFGGSSTRSFVAVPGMPALSSAGQALHDRVQPEEVPR